jgi:hypothetical protein
MDRFNVICHGRFLSPCAKIGNPVPVAIERSCGNWDLSPDLGRRNNCASRAVSFGMRFLVTSALLALTATASAGTRPAVVELFTSQGCSSCPPAEAYVGKLTARQDVIALAFHVTYWDDLGWRDRFALTEAVDRQNVYAQNFRSASVYTPQLIVDGLSGTPSTNLQLQATADGVPVAVTAVDHDLQVEVGTNAQFAAADVILVPYLRHAVSAIGRGENAGRQLEEFNIVRGIHKLGPWRGAGTHFTVPISSLSGDATDVAVLVQAPGQKAILGAATQVLR